MGRHCEGGKQDLGPGGDFAADQKCMSACCCWGTNMVHGQQSQHEADLTGTELHKEGNCSHISISSELDQQRMPVRQPTGWSPMRVAMIG